MNLQSCGKYDRTNDFVFEQYKHYKRKKPEPNLDDVIDFTNSEKYKEKITKIDLTMDSDGTNYCSVGLKHPKDWEVYELNTSPGFIVIVNPFISDGAQSHWIKQSLTEYTKKPYPCNLDVLMELDKEKTIWEISHGKSGDNKFINQLRWVHMGYHFDYNVVDYKAKQYFGFPKDLATLTETIASVFKFPNYFAETGIINYYPPGSSMGGHTDHYEEALSQPLISYSFGQSAIYLIGGQTRDVKPEAIWVRSGDIMLMTGPSRTAYHAVPRVFTKTSLTGPKDIGSLTWSDENTECVSEQHEQCFHIWKNELNNEWKEFEDYLKNTRININIRQVHKYSSNSELI